MGSVNILYENDNDCIEGTSFSKSFIRDTIQEASAVFSTSGEKWKKFFKSIREFQALLGLIMIRLQIVY